MLVVVLRAALQNKYINEPKMSPVTLKRKKRKKKHEQQQRQTKFTLGYFCVIYSVLMILAI